MNIFDIKMKYQLLYFFHSFEMSNGTIASFKRKKIQDRNEWTLGSDLSLSEVKNQI